MKQNQASTNYWLPFLGLLSSLFLYRYGISDQIEQLPIIMRFIDGNYLKNDIFVNASSGFGPRYYYAHFVSFWARMIGLESSLFLLTVLAHVGMGWVSFRATKSLFPKLEHAGLLGAALVLAMPVFELGSDLSLFGAYLSPGLLVTPLVLYAVWKAWEAKYIHLSIAAGLASIFHVLYGLETGFLLLGSCFVFCLLTKDWKELKKILLAGIILLLFSLATLIPYLSLEKSLEAKTFIHILAYFRHPHHYLPSYILANDNTFLGVLGFLSAVFVVTAGLFSRRTFYGKRDPREGWFLSFFALLMLALLAGWVFVEVIPSRLFATAQLWRLLNLFKWLYLLLLAGQLAMFLPTKNALQQGIYLLAAIHPISAALFLTSLHKEKVPPLRWVLYIACFLLLLFLLVKEMLPTNYLLLALTYVLFLCLYLQGNKRWAMLFLGLALLFPILQMSLFPRILPPAVRQYSDKIVKPYIFEPAYEEEVLQFSNFAREQLPEDALILTPPGFGGMRIAGRRAVVTDFKAFPFGDDAIAEWYERVSSIYSKWPASRSTSQSEMKRIQRMAYKGIDSQRLELLDEKYPFSHAIVHKGEFRRRDGSFMFPVLLEGEEFILIENPASRKGEDKQ